MSFTNAKMLNESFMNMARNVDKVNDEDEIITLRQVDENIKSCKGKIISLREQYDELRATWLALNQDADSLGFISKMQGSDNLLESFNKAVADLRMEYEDTKTTLQFYKDVKNKALLEADVTIPRDQLMDPDRPISLRGLAIDSIRKEKEAEAARIKAEEKAKAQQEAKPLLDAIAKIEADSPKSFFTALFNLLVPDQGKCNTQAGELLRAIGKILYRDWNDGDKFYQGYGLETAAPAAAFLMDNGYWDEFESIMDHVTGDDNYDSDNYTRAIEIIRDKIVDDVQDIELLSQPPVMDMLDADISYIEENQPRYEYEIQISEDLERHLDEQNVDSWRIKEYIEDQLSWDNAYEGAEVSNPWSHYDNNYTIENLTIDGRDQLEHIFRIHGSEGFFEDLVNELNEEYPLADEDEDQDDFENVDAEEDLDESFLCEAVLMETGDEDLLITFMDLYPDNTAMKARVDRILNEYRQSENELPEDLFSKASVADQSRIIELLQK